MKNVRQRHTAAQVKASSQAEWVPSMPGRHLNPARSCKICVADLKHKKGAYINKWIEAEEKKSEASTDNVWKYKEESQHASFDHNVSASSDLRLYLYFWCSGR